MEKALISVTHDNLKVALAASVLKSQKSSDNQTLEILQDAYERHFSILLKWGVCLSDEMW